MNGKERAMRTINFKEIDKVPIVGGFVIKSSFLEKVSGGMNFWENPCMTAIKAYRALDVDLIIQLLLPFSKDQFWYDDWRKIKFNLDAYKSPEEVIDYIDKLPSRKELKNSFNSEEAYKEYLNNYTYNQANIGEDILWLPGHIAGLCKFEWYENFGYENYFMALILYKNKLQNLFEYSAEEGKLKNEAIAMAIKKNNLPPVVYLGEDICGNGGPMISLKDLDEIYFPNLEYSLKPLVDNEIKIIWHCDGNITTILDRLLKIGVDGFQGFQEELGVDIKKISGLRTKKNNKPLLVGSVSTTSTFPFGSTQDIRDSVKRCIDIMAPEGGFMLAPSHSVCPEVPDENIIEFFSYGKEYGYKFLNK
ncbi:MAG: hypothetical protein M1308_23075 [Actinobacteria bacterium]|nr:hypothetical protein [Actinomycetota bacterium]